MGTPDYRLIAALEREIFGEVETVDPVKFKYRCPHCQTINRRGKGMEHAFDCIYKGVQTK